MTNGFMSLSSLIPRQRADGWLRIQHTAEGEALSVRCDKIQTTAMPCPRDYEALLFPIKVHDRTNFEVFSCRSEYTPIQDKRESTPTLPERRKSVDLEDICDDQLDLGSMSISDPSSAFGLHSYTIKYDSEDSYDPALQSVNGNGHQPKEDVARRRRSQQLPPRLPLRRCTTL